MDRITKEDLAYVREHGTDEGLIKIARDSLDFLWEQTAPGKTEKA